MIEAEADPELLRFVQNEILKNPSAGDIVQGTGGIQKVRVAGKGKGKSGGYRILFLDLPKRSLTILLAIYAKGVQENISEEDKAKLRELVRIQKGE